LLSCAVFFSEFIHSSIFSTSAVRDMIRTDIKMIMVYE
jgi:hypothetical protein